MSSVFYKELDIGTRFLYDSGMDELTIAQIEKILGWSYPTALKFAKVNGRQEDGERGQWFVPANVIDEELKARARAVQEQRQLFYLCLGGLATPAASCNEG